MPADAPNIRIQTSATEAIRSRMQAALQGQPGRLFDSGAVGFTNDGMVAMRDAAKVPLSQRAQANATVADENRDRAALYREVASANGHPEWESQIRATFAKGWIEKAPRQAGITRTPRAPGRQQVSACAAPPSTVIGPI